MTHAIHVDHLNKTFAKKPALVDLELTVAAGEMVALIGASGSGKSTLLRHLAGLACCDKRNGGSVKVLGREVQASGRLNGKVRRLRADIGYIFQQFNLVNRLSVLDNVLLGCLGRMPRWRGNLGLFNAEEKAFAMASLARVGLADLAAQRASTLSGGQQQRVAIARALAMEPEIILFDEPTSALDPELVGEVLKVIQTLAEEGRTMLMVTHEMGFARQVSSQVLFLHQGRVEEHGGAEILDHPNSERLQQFLSNRLK